MVKTLLVFFMRTARQFDTRVASVRRTFTVIWNIAICHRYQFLDGVALDFMLDAEQRSNVMGYAKGSRETFKFQQ